MDLSVLKPIYMDLSSLTNDPVTWWTLLYVNNLLESEADQNLQNENQVVLSKTKQVTEPRKSAGKCLLEGRGGCWKLLFYFFLIFSCIYLAGTMDST